MHFENLVPAFQIGQGDFNLSVESSGSQEGGVQQFRPVGGSHDYHIGVSGESLIINLCFTVHFNEELVEGGVPLLVPAALSLLANRVDFIYENDAG
jgi:hypothetical protein